jgi:hypothetical protein
MNLPLVSLLRVVIITAGAVVVAVIIIIVLSSFVIVITSAVCICSRPVHRRPEFNFRQIHVFFQDNSRRFLKMVSSATLSLFQVT